MPEINPGQMASGDQSEYRPLSTLAVWAVVAGAASALALTTPILWVVPMLSIGLVAAALADTRPGSLKTGRGLALAGLALAVGFGSQAVVSTVVRRGIASARAVAAASGWVDAIRNGRLEDAHRMCSPAALPPSDAFESHEHDPESPGHDHDHDQAGQNALAIEAFAGLPAVAAIRRCGTAGQIALGVVTNTDDLPDAWRVQLSLTGCGAGPELVDLWLEPSVLQDRRPVRSAWPGRGLERWLIVKIDPGFE